MKTTDTTLPKFSYFYGPITNIWPKANVTIVDIFRSITGDFYKNKTDQLRKVKNPDEYRKAKKHLDFVTFGGTFVTRVKQNLNQASGYCCIDLDHIDPAWIETIKQILITDPLIETALLFRSPSGLGLKWVVEIDLEKYPDYELNFRGIIGYLRTTYPDQFNCGENILDTSVSDISRACFLCFDAEAWINPKYLDNGNN